MMKLEVDKNRMHLKDATGIYVRAIQEDKWGSYDIAVLTKKSLKDWLDSMPNGALDACGILLGHGHLSILERD